MTRVGASVLIGLMACSQAVDDDPLRRQLAGGTVEGSGARPVALDATIEPLDAETEEIEDAEPEGHEGSGDAAVPSLRVVINEVAAMAEPDWFELYNPGARPVDLGGFTYADDLSAEREDVGTIPQGTVLGPGALLVVEIDKEELGFALGKDEALGLWDAEGALVDRVDWEDGDSPEGGSYGRIPDGTGPFTTLPVASPGTPNAPAEE